MSFDVAPDTDEGYSDMSTKSTEIPGHVTECGLQNYVENIVEEIILEDKAFDEYKDELQRRCEEAGVDYNNLECDLEDFLQNLNIGIKSPDGLAIGMAMAFAMEDAGKCFVSQEKLEQIVEMWNERHPNKEFHPHNSVINNDED